MESRPSATSPRTASGQPQQAQRVRDRAAILADPLGQHLLRVPELADQPLVTGRFLERVQILALEVLHQRHFERLRGATSRTTAGTSCSPARCAARQRRSPAISS